MNESQNLIQEAFSALENQKERFLKCERAYRAKYKENNRTSKLKSTKRSQSKLYIPLIKTTVNIIHSIFKTSFMGDKCPIEISRVGYRSDSDLILQNALSVMLKEKWKSKEHRTGLSKAVLSALYLPLGIVNLYYDKQVNDIRTKFVPITDLAFDKNASDIHDIEYVAYKRTQSKREIRDKFKSGFYKSKESHLLIGENARVGERVKMQDIYIKSYENGKTIWKLESYADEILVRKANFSRLPFHFGYCIEAMPSVSEDERTEEIAVYGSCLPELVYEIQEEYNIKRNQKINIVERSIDPVFIVDKNAGDIAISDISANLKFIRAETMNGARVSDLIQPLPAPSPYGLSEEINMLNHEYEIATGVNSVMTGQTSPSDRRAGTALQIVNAASSSRVESMLQTLLETMLTGYAQHFVELIYRFASDEDFIKATEDPNIIAHIGTQSERKSSKLDFNINTNFGTTISSDMKINQLQGLMGVLAQSGINSPQIAATILKQILTYIMGENAPIEQIDEAIAGQQMIQEQITQEQTQESEPSEDELRMMAIANGGV